MKTSAGILLYRNNLEVLLVHPGGPFYINKDLGMWSIPKGEIENNEDVFSTAIREFQEETNCTITSNNIINLSSIKTPNKTIFIWAIKQDFNTKNFRSNNFSLEYPAKSGIIQSFPEVDAIQWFTIKEAKLKINKNQVPFLERLENNVI